MTPRSLRRIPLGVLAVAAVLLVACGESSSAIEDETGGATTSATGGSTAAATGGTSTETGGVGGGTGGASGGSVSTGAGATGGSVPAGSGGVSTGGVSAGGAAQTGGTATGGSVPAGSGGDSNGGSGGGAAGGSGGNSTGGRGIGGRTGRGGSGGSATGGTDQAGSGGASTGGSSAGGTASGGQAAAGGDAATGGAGGSPLPPTTDYSAPGPFETTTDANAGPNGVYTVFRPKTLGENGFLHAPIVFGPGIGMQATQLSSLLLSFASHGFVVVGTGVLDGGPNDPGNKSDMENALDWILEQNDQPGTYQGKLDVTHAVSMGYSVGGTAAVEIGGHAAVATVVSIHGHTATAALHGPMLQTSGTADTVGLPMQQKTFDQSQVQTFLGTVTGADHGYIQRENGGAERPAIIAWMRYWIYNDTGARDYFWGDDCVLCKAPWENPQRKNWE
jgi:hypothetical protein